LALGRTKESYIKRKLEHKINLLKKIEIKETKDFIGTKKNRAKLFENCNLISLDGILYKNIFNLNEFCKLNNIKDSWKLQEVIKEKRISSEGWVKYFVRP
jgi:hypothetical protein